MIRPLSLLLVLGVVVGCGGGGHVAARESYAGRYVLPAGTTGGAVVLDLVGGRAEGSVAVGGSVYDFAGRIGDDGELAATGDGIVVQAHLASVSKGLSGTLSLSGAVSVEGARASLSRAEDP